jgi:2-amino-4-hydroxy-6-hydroxymethyldihydropteridine diphosphokinase
MSIVLISIGSNLDNPKAQVESAIEYLGESFNVLHRSSLYETEPLNIESNQNFINAALLIDSELSPQDLLDRLLAIEKSAGRRRSSEHVPTSRQLDLDIVLYGEEILDDHIKVPHPRFKQRRFVLEPAAEIAADMMDPESRLTIGELLEICPDISWVKKVEVQVVSS